jgi:Leucine-rich repeat (LRR) protein
LSSLSAESFMVVGSSLRALSLDHNGLEFIYGRAFVGLSHLVSLVLSDNRMTFLPGDSFVGMRNLTTLLLSRTSLRSLFSRVFGGLVNLDRLDLSANELGHLPDGTLRDSERLRHLDLANNKLRTLSPCILARRHEASLKTLSLVGNAHIQCDCRLTWLVVLLSLSSLYLQSDSVTLF